MVQKMDPTNYRFPHFKKPNNKMGNIKCNDVNDRDPQKPSQQQDTRQCLVCRSNFHLLRFCKLYKQNKNRHWNRNNTDNKWAK